MRRSAILLLSPLLPLAVGCESNPLAPEDFAATYVLEAVGDDPLPVVTYEDGLVTFTLLADTLRLDGEGRGTEVRVSRAEWSDPTRPDGIITTPATLGYRVRGRRIEIGYGCPSLLDRAAPPAWGAPPARRRASGDVALPTSCAPTTGLIGRLDGGMLLLHDGETEVRYRRLDP